MARRMLAVALVVLVALAGCQSPLTSDGTPTGTTTPETTTPETTTPTTTTTSTGMVDSRPDPKTDALGWEDGYWYNETIPVTVSDGLNASERNATIARAMARVEHIRQVEFEKPVPVEVISRETYREEYAKSGNTSDAMRTFDDTKFEALFLVGEDRNSLDVQESNRGSNVLGFYTPKDDRIVVISESETPTIEETTLGHELVHALQFRNFDANFSSPTRDAANAHKGLIEGEAAYVDNAYSERCGDGWTCVSPSSSGGGGGGDLHLGVYIMKYFPYSDGPGFVSHFHDQGGWNAVEDLYDDPAETSEQVAQPEKYGVDEPTDVSLPDRSAANWERVTPAGRAPYGEVGVGGLTAMLAYPAYHQDRPGYVLNPREFLNRGPNGNVDMNDPFNYTTTPVRGWDGERMWIYESDGGETAYTWRIAWDSPQDAREFAESYRSLLQYWGGERVDAETARWRIPEGESAFADAFRLTVDGDTVTIVNAPTVDQLDDVHDPA